jgi:lysophospholipase L1-like esterase
MRRRLRFVLVLLLLILSAAAYVFWSMGNANFWESSIRKFEADERIHPPKSGAILFVGSSSIRFWNTLAADMAPLEVINRGFGGSQLAHVNHFADRIVLPYRPRAIVLYAGDNDLSWPWSKSPQTVLDDFKQFVAIVHTALPGTWIYYVSMKPSPMRWSHWPTEHHANQMIEEFTFTQDRVQFIDVASPMLDAGGKVRRDIFRLDGLHMNPRGYVLWSSIIKPILLQRFPVQKADTAVGSQYPARTKLSEPVPTKLAPIGQSYPSGEVHG